MVNAIVTGCGGARRDANQMQLAGAADLIGVRGRRREYTVKYECIVQMQSRGFMSELTLRATHVEMSRDCRFDVRLLIVL